MADVLRAVVSGLAAMVAGATAIVLVLYMRAYIRRPSGTGILPRHVVEVSAGTLGLVVGIGIATYDTIGHPSLTWRLWLYLVSLILIVVAVVEVGNLQRQRLAESEEPEPEPEPQSETGRHRWK